MILDLDAIQARAEAAAEAVGEEWSWDDGILIDLCRHESPIGIECTWASGSPAAPHIAGMDPQTTLALVAELRAAQERDQIANSMRALLTDIVVNEILVDENIVWARDLLAAYEKVAGGGHDA